MLNCALYWFNIYMGKWYECMYPLVRISRNFNNLSLKKKYLFSHTIGVLLTVAIISPASYYIARSAVETKVSEFSSEILQKSTVIWNNKIREVADYFIARFELIDLSNAMSISSGEDRALRTLRLERDLADIITYRSEIQFIMIDSRFGERFFSQASGQSWDQADISALVPYDYIRRLHARPYMRMLEDNCILFSKVIFDLQTSEYLGILTVGYHPSFFSRALPQRGNDAVGTLQIIDSLNGQGVLVYPASGSAAQAIENLAGNESFGSETRFRSGGQRFVVERYHSPGGRWIFQSVTDTRDLAGLSLAAGFHIGAATVLALLSALLLSVYFSNREILRIHGITDYARQIAGGMLSIASVDRHKDELGMLSTTLEDLAHRISALVDNLAAERVRLDEARYASLQFEYNALQSNINPHFIYNSLEMVNAAAKLKGEWEISEMVQIIGDLMRESIERRERQISLGQELKYIDKYLRMQNMLHEDRLEISYRISDEAKTVLVPNFILQPLVENAITHGIEPLNQVGRIAIEARLETGVLRVSIWDNGSGMSDSEMNRALMGETSGSGHRKMGLVNVNRRMKILYGEHFGVRLHSPPGGGTVVSLNFPVAEHSLGSLKS